MGRPMVDRLVAAGHEVRVLGRTQERRADLETLPHGSSASFALSAVARRGSVTAFTEAVRELLAKDVAVVRRVAADQGATLGVLDAAIGELSL